MIAEDNYHRGHLETNIGPKSVRQNSSNFELLPVREAENNMGKESSTNGDINFFVEAGKGGDVVTKAQESRGGKVMDSSQYGKSTELHLEDSPKAERGKLPQK